MTHAEVNKMFNGLPLLLVHCDCVNDRVRTTSNGGPQENKPCASNHGPSLFHVDVSKYKAAFAQRVPLVAVCANPFQCHRL